MAQEVVTQQCHAGLLDLPLWTQLGAALQLQPRAQPCDNLALSMGSFDVCDERDWERLSSYQSRFAHKTELSGLAK